MAMRVIHPRGKRGGQYGMLEARQEALRLGLPTYISPTPCKRRGHTGPRRTLYGKCIECEKEDARIQNEKRRAEKRGPVKVAGTSLAAWAMSRTTDLTPKLKNKEPQCQPQTKKK